MATNIPATAPLDGEKCPTLVASSLPLISHPFVDRLLLQIDIEDIIRYFDPTEYFVTGKKNKISKKTVLWGMRRIVLSGKVTVMEGTILRGDLAQMKIGRYSTVGRDCVIRPSYKISEKRQKAGKFFLTLLIGSNVIIGHNCIVQASIIGCNVIVGDGCIVNNGCILRDCCMLLPGTILAPHTMVPPFSLFGGSPGRFICELPDCIPNILEEVAMNTFNTFISTSAAKKTKTPRRRSLSGTPPTTPTSSTPATTPTRTQASPTAAAAAAAPSDT